MSLYSTVTCYEEFGTAKETHDLENGMSASVTLRCDWGNRHTLVADLLGNSRTWPHGGWASPPRAQRCSVRPDRTAFSASGQCIVYDCALVDVQYGTKIVDLVSESIEPTADFVTLDYRRFRWGNAAGDPLIENEAPGKLRRGLSLVRTLYHLAAVPTVCLTGVGGVNHVAYASSLLGLTFDAETLLFTPPKASRTITTAGTEGWNLSLKFMFKPETWNKYWRIETETYEELFLVNGGAAYKSYPLTDFSSLLF